GAVCLIGAVGLVFVGLAFSLMFLCLMTVCHGPRTARQGVEIPPAEQTSQEQQSALPAGSFLLGARISETVRSSVLRGRSIARTAFTDTLGTFFPVRSLRFIRERAGGPHVRLGTLDEGGRVLLLTTGSCPQTG